MKPTSGISHVSMDLFRIGKTQSQSTKLRVSITAHELTHLNCDSSILSRIGEKSLATTPPLRMTGYLEAGEI